MRSMKLSQLEGVVYGGCKTVVGDYYGKLLAEDVKWEDFIDTKLYKETLKDQPVARVNVVDNQMLIELRYVSE